MNKTFGFLFFTLIHSILFGQKMTREQYINTYYQLAVEEMNIHKIPASITLAQGLLETESGNSALCSKAKNHFGIKCKLTWTGMKFIKDDDAKDECFRAYTSDQESFRDHSLFLKGDRYLKLFSYDLKDYRSWAYGLKECGYATNPKYPQMLIKHIEELKLYQFDSYGYDNHGDAVSSTPTVDLNANTPENITIRKEKANQLDLIIVDSSFNIYELALKKKLSIKQLMQFNDLENEQSLRIGQNFFLQNKTTGNLKGYHEVQLGQSLYDIAQMYGVTIFALRKINKLEPWEQPLVGEKVSLHTQQDGFIKTRPFYEVERERAKMTLNQPNSTYKEPISIQKKTVLEPITMENKPIATEEPKTEPSTGDKVWITHKVDKKETIFKLSKIYDCRPDEILEWNNITVEQGLGLGQLVRILTAYPKGKKIDVKKNEIDKPSPSSKPLKIIIENTDSILRKTNLGDSAAKISLNQKKQIKKEKNISKTIPTNPISDTTKPIKTLNIPKKNKIPLRMSDTGASKAPSSFKDVNPSLKQRFDSIKSNQVPSTPRLKKIVIE